MKKLNINYGDGVTDYLFDLEDRKVFSYFDDAEEVERLYEGDCYYTSRSGLSRSANIDDLGCNIVVPAYRPASHDWAPTVKIGLWDVCVYQKRNNTQIDWEDYYPIILLKTEVELDGKVYPFIVRGRPWSVWEVLFFSEEEIKEYARSSPKTDIQALHPFTIITKNGYNQKITGIDLGGLLYDWFRPSFADVHGTQRLCVEADRLGMVKKGDKYALVDKKRSYIIGVSEWFLDPYGWMGILDFEEDGFMYYRRKFNIKEHRIELVYFRPRNYPFEMADPWIGYELSIPEREYWKEPGEYVKAIIDLTLTKERKQWVLQERRRRQNQKFEDWVEENKDLTITIKDSISAGNCEVGTTRFRDRHFPGRDEVRVEELKPYLNNYGVLAIIESKMV